MARAAQDADVQEATSPPPRRDAHGGFFSNSNAEALMTLWTPNRKTLDPMPLCQRCGGWKLPRGFSADTRRWMSFHRVCCCRGCKSTRTITLTHGTPCECSPGGRTHELQDLAYAGSYNVPLLDGTTCNYQTTFAEDSPPYAVDRDCGTAEENDYSQLRPFISITPEKVVQVVQVVLLSAPLNPVTIFEFTGSAALGDTLNNNIVCADEKISEAVEGGTAIVT